MAVQLTINGSARLVAGDAMTPLGQILREDLHLTGTKLACGEGFCGACSVMLDDRVVLSCLTPLALAAGRSVETIEAKSEPLSIKARLQQALEEFDAVQCGMCFPGMVISLSAYLAQAEQPTRDDLRQALVGNICRCTGYERIIDAALSIVGSAET
jgi:aerobic carbon-monoxide dehydrogenase small subunit